LCFPRDEIPFFKEHHMTRGISTAVFLLGGTIALFCQGFTALTGATTSTSETPGIAEESVVLNDWNFTHDRPGNSHHTREHRLLAQHQQSHVARVQALEDAGRFGRARSYRRLIKCERQKLQAHWVEERQSGSQSTFDILTAHDECRAAIFGS
jgi:hypothetical protein